MKCPSCAAAAADGAAECPACGVIFAKFEERRRREREAAAAALAQASAPPAPLVDPQLGRTVAVVLAAGWVLAFGYFIFKDYRRRQALREARLSAAQAQFAAPVAVSTAVSAHAVIVDAAGNFSTPSGETLAPPRR